MLVWLGCAVVGGYLGLAQDVQSFLRYGPWLALVAWFVYLAQWLPRLVIGSEGLRMVNGLRTHRIPFSRIRDLGVRQSVTVSTVDGRRYTSWGAPIPRNAIAAGMDVSRGRQIQVLTPTNERLRAASAADPARDAIVRAWETAKRNGFANAGGSVVSTWNAATIGAGILAAVWVLLSVVL
ncbi:MAG TPA: PH domain-containing protein [Micrococcaceae bacterium]|nr:PH domain-containing protein [Micrococcaceae bacterium]